MNFEFSLKQKVILDNNLLEGFHLIISCEQVTQLELRLTQSNKLCLNGELSLEWSINKRNSRKLG